MIETTDDMKTKTILLGVVIAAISLLSINQASAQNEAIQAKVLPSQKGMIKVIYSNPTEEPVEIKFSDRDGIIKKDKISGESFDNGFAKRYKIKRQSGDAFWVEINSQDVSVTYKMTSTRNGLWSAELEKTTHHPVVASN